MSNPVVEGINKLLLSLLKSERFLEEIASETIETTLYDTDGSSVVSEIPLLPVVETILDYYSTISTPITHLFEDRIIWVDRLGDIDSKYMALELVDAIEGYTIIEYKITRRLIHDGIIKSNLTWIKI